MAWGGGDALVAALQDPEEQVRRILRQNAGKPKPTVPGAFVHGLSMGYTGTPPEGVGQVLAEMTGSAVPFAVAAFLTGGAGGAIPSLARVLSESAGVGAAGAMGIHGALTGGTVGLLSKADSLEDRLSRTLIDTSLGGLTSFGLGKFAASKAAKRLGRSVDLSKAEGLQAEFPEGAFSKIDTAIQGELPLPSVDKLRAETKAVGALLGGDVSLTHKAKPQKTLDWLKKEASAKRLWLQVNPVGEGKYKILPEADLGNVLRKPQVFDSIEDAFAFVEKSHGPLTQGPAPFQIHNSLTGETLHFDELGKAQKYVRGLAAKDPNELQQLSLFGASDTELTRVAPTKGYDVREHPGGFTLTGMGGRVEHFTTGEEAKAFLRLQPEVQRLPADVYGTFERAVNGKPWTPVDEKAAALQSAITKLPRVTLGGPMSGGIRTLGDRMRMNVVTGLRNEGEVAAAQRAILDKGYKFSTPYKVGETYELAYAPKWDRQTTQAMKSYFGLRLGSRVPEDAMYNMAAVMGMTAPEINNWMWHEVSRFAPNDGVAKTMLLGQLGYPQMAESPVVSAVSREVFAASAQYEKRLDWVYSNVRDRFLKPLSEQEAGHVSAIIEGERGFAEAPLKVQEAANAYRTLMKEMAQLKGLPEWESYLTHISDMDALWAATRESILKDAKMWQLRGLDPKVLGKLQEYAGSQTGEWRTLDKGVRDFIKENAFNWNVADWSKLPATIRNAVPEAVFNPYLIKRVGGKVPYERNILKIFDRYVPTMLRSIEFDPVLERVKPILDAMPGADQPLSERRFLEAFINKIVMNKTTTFEKGLESAQKELHDALGSSFSNQNVVRDLTTLYRGSQYRGLLGIDSAFRHVNKIINVAAENGVYLGAAFKHLPDIALRRSIVRVPGVTALHGADITEIIGRPGADSVMQKAIRFSNVANNITLAPMQLVENVMRGFSWHAAMEQGARMGLNNKEVLHYAAGKASKILPNFEMTEAQYRAMLNVMKTDFGFSIEQNPPIWSHPLARLSTLFMTYPVRQMEFLSKGISSSFNNFLTTQAAAGYHEAFRTIDNGKLLRYLASTGFLFGIPYFTAKLGVDTSNFFGAHMMHFSFPFWHSISNVYSAAVGDKPLSRESAKRELTEAFLASAIPQYRQLKRFQDAERNLARGYAVDQEQKYIHDATPFGEVMKTMGVPSTSYTHAQSIAREWRDIAATYGQEKHQALQEMVQNGNTKAAEDFLVKWGRPISAKDVQKTVTEMKQTPQRRAVQTVPMEVLVRMAQEKPWLFER